MLDLDNNVSDRELRQLLESATVIAMVGASDDHYYTSYQVASYLQEKGYIIYPVNPNIDDVDGHRSYPSLSAVPAPISTTNGLSPGKCFFQKSGDTWSA